MKYKPTPTESLAVLISIMVQLPEKVGYTKSYVNRKGKIDLYKYASGKSSPRLSSLCTYCKFMGIDPGFFMLMVELVATRELSEKQALTILASPDLIKKAMIHYDQLFLDIINHHTTINQPEPTQ